MNYLDWQRTPCGHFMPPSWEEAIKKQRREFVDTYTLSKKQEIYKPDIDVSEMIADLERMSDGLNLDFDAGRMDIIIQQFLPDGKVIKIPEEKIKSRHLSFFPQRNTTLYMNSDTAYKLFFKIFDFDVALECCKNIAMSEVNKVIEQHSLPFGKVLISELKNPSEWEIAEPRDLSSAANYGMYHFVTNRF